MAAVDPEKAIGLIQTIVMYAELLGHGWKNLCMLSQLAVMLRIWKRYNLKKQGQGLKVHVN